MLTINILGVGSVEVLQFASDVTGGAEALVQVDSSQSAHPFIIWSLEAVEDSAYPVNSFHAYNGRYHLTRLTAEVEWDRRYQQ